MILKKILKNHFYLFVFSILYLFVFFLKLDVIPMVVYDEGYNAFYIYSKWGGSSYDLTTSVFNPIFFIYYYLLSGWTKLFGFSLWVMRSLSVALGLVGLIGFYKLIISLTKNKWVLISGLSTFLMTNFAVIFFRQGRPEVLVLVCLIWSLYFFINAIQKNTLKLLFFSGFLMGVMVIAHPQALAVVVATLLVLWMFSIDKKEAYKQFVLGGVLTIIIIGIKLGFESNFNLQQANSLFDNLQFFKRVRVGTPSSGLIEDFSLFFNTYTLGVKRLYILVFEIGILILGAFKYRKDQLISKLSLMGILTFLLGLTLLSPFRRRYMGMIMIFSIIVCLLIIIKERSKFRTVVFLMLALYFTNNVLGNIYYVFKQYKNTPYSRIGSELQQQLLPGSKVITPIQLWIALYPYYVITHVHDQLYENNVTLYEKINEMEYIVFSQYFLKNISSTTTEEAIGYQLDKHSFNNVLREVAQTKEWKEYYSLKTHPYKTIKIYKKEVKTID